MAFYLDNHREVLLSLEKFHPHNLYLLNLKLKKDKNLKIII